MTAGPILVAPGGRLDDVTLSRFGLESVIGASLFGRAADESAIDAYRVDTDAAYLGSLLRDPRAPRRTIQVGREVATEIGVRVDSDGSGRLDSFSPNAGLFMARQLEQIVSRVLETPYPVLNGPILFPANTEVAPGARTYTIRRFADTGEAVIWRGGNGIPRVGMTQQETTRPVRHIASSFAYDIFDQMAANFANIGLVSGLMKACRKACAQRWNQLIWYGNAAADIYGVLTYPYLAKKLAATPFDGTAQPPDVIAELDAAASYAAETSDDVFASTACAATREVINYLKRTMIDPANNTSIYKWWIENNTAGIKEIKVAQELKAGGSIPTGCHGILFYKDGDEDSIRNVVPQPFTTTPVQRIGVEDVTICYQSTGGISMPDVGNNLLLFVEV